jgi:hypothetical protein
MRQDVEVHVRSLGSMKLVIIDWIVDTFELEETMVRRRFNIFLTLVPLSNEQLESIAKRLRIPKRYYKEYE